MRQKTTLRKPVIKTLAVVVAAVSTMLFTSGPAMAGSIDNGDCNPANDAFCSLIHFKLNRTNTDIDIVPLTADSPSCDTIKAGTDYYAQKKESANFWFKPYPYVAIRGGVAGRITVLPNHYTSTLDCRGQGGHQWGLVPFGSGLNVCFEFIYTGRNEGVFNYRGSGSECNDA